MAPGFISFSSGDVQPFVITGSTVDNKWRLSGICNIDCSVTFPPIRGNNLLWMVISKSSNVPITVQRELPLCLLRIIYWLSMMLAATKQMVCLCFSPILSIVTGISEMMRPFSYLFGIEKERNFTFSPGASVDGCVCTGEIVRCYLYGWQKRFYHRS